MVVRQHLRGPAGEVWTISRITSPHETHDLTQTAVTTDAHEQRAYGERRDDAGKRCGTAYHGSDKLPEKIVESRVRCEKEKHSTFDPNTVHLFLFVLRKRDAIRKLKFA